MPDRLTFSTVLSGVMGLFGIPCLSETYGPIIRKRKTQTSPDPEKNALDSDSPYQGMTKTQYIIGNVTRPLVLLTSFLCFILSLYMALYVSSFLLSSRLNGVQFVWHLLPDVCYFHGYVPRLRMWQ
jgi:hypothetical protein